MIAALRAGRQNITQLLPFKLDINVPALAQPSFKPLSTVHASAAIRCFFSYVPVSAKTATGRRLASHTIPAMNPADLQRTDNISHHGSSTPLLASRPLPTPTIKPVEPEKKKTTPRVEIEPIYTALKQGMGEGWTKYKEAISGFIQGKKRLNLSLDLRLSRFKYTNILN